MKTWIICLAILFHLPVYSQTKINYKPEHYLGIQARLIDLMPFEVSYLRIKPKGPSFALRFGYGMGQQNETTTETYNYVRQGSNSSINFYTNYGRNFNYFQTFEAIFIKPGFILHKSRGIFFTHFFLVNYCLSKSFDKITIIADDQLYGKVELNYYENHTYQSVELEGNHQIMLGKKINLGMGYVVGYKLQNEVPFTNLIYGIDENSQYSPAQGIGTKAYLNLLVALLYKF